MNRPEARAAAMKLIYEWEMGGDGGEETVKGLLEIDPEEAEYDYTCLVTEGVKENAESLDGTIQKYISGWKIDRLSKVDLAILRVGAYELSMGKIPSGIVINEAVKLSNAYSTDRSGSFVNGVLGEIARNGKN